MKQYNIVVGSGIAGAVVARRVAEEKNEKVIVIEKKNHIGGYCYDYRDKNGILVHKFGPHIFRTNSRAVWDYVSRFSSWEEYQHKVLSYVNGSFYPIPINLDTVNGFLGTEFSSLDVGQYFDQVKKTDENINSVKNVIESQVGSLFYEMFFKNYTLKQWGKDPSELPKEIVARIPVRTNRDDRYFTHKYQGMPQDGYTNMILNILDHKNIKVLLNTDYKEVKGQIQPRSIYYSGAIDEYYDYCFGKLPYRCVSFDIQTLDVDYYQPVAVVNYPNDYNFTRITEYKHFYKEKKSKTTIAKEFPSDKGEPAYPIPCKENLSLYERYYSLSKNENVKFIGRLGEYRYYSMDQIIEKMLKEKLY